LNAFAIASELSDYLEFSFKVNPLQPATDILIAELGELGFESFVELEEGLLAYVPNSLFDRKRFDGLYLWQNSEFHIEWQQKPIAQQNWNALWEENFEPIRIDNSCLVRAPFHETEDVRYEIVIMPKMSFGTGHHETTHMMLQQMLQIDFKGKRVLDMGCGTAVLAILAEMRGAMSIDAIDIDSWSYQNAQENIQRNECQNISVYHGDATLLGDNTYDVILANINRNILLNDIGEYVNCMSEHGQLLLSGFYTSDLDAISSKCGAHGLRFEKKLQKNDWVSAKYVI